MFEIKEPSINVAEEIEKHSLQAIESEAREYYKFLEFNYYEQEVIKRLIHATTCFDEVIKNIYFSKNSITNIGNLLKDGAKIIVDTNMIKSGISEFYLKEYSNEVICLVNEKRVFELAKENSTTRSYSAVSLAIKENSDKPLVLACGNAPTFIYSAIKTLIEEEIDLSRVAILTFPVGFINVVEAKEYAREFMDYYNSTGIIMQGRFGSSTMIVSTIHAIYKLLKENSENK